MEEETGNTITTAGKLVPGSYVSDQIDAAGDSDWFEINLIAGETYTFTVYLPPAGLADSILNLRDNMGVLITTNDDANLQAGLRYSEIRFTATQTDTFYLDVTGFANATGAYVISSSRPFEDIVGDSPATAGSIVVGDDAIIGELEEIGDRDWFSVTLVAGETYEIRTAPTNGGNDVDTTLTLRDANGNVIAFNDDRIGTYSEIRFTAPTSGTFYLDVGAWGDSEQGAYQIIAALSDPLVELDNDGIAALLLYGSSGDVADLRRFDVNAGDSITVNITTLAMAGQFLAREAMALWTDVTGIVFQEVTGGAQISFQDTENGAYAQTTVAGGTIVKAIVNVSSNWLASFGTTLNSYSFQTYLHEVGHALGLRHPGNYNGSGNYPQDAEFLNDSWATTLMSYFSQTENEFFADQGFDRRFTITPMSADIVAAQFAYGGATGTRIGDNTYGVGNDSGRAVYGVGDEVTNNAGDLLAFVIIDNGGNDTINYSTFTDNQLINLNQETFSSVGGSVGNMSIARGTVIENAIAGAGSDELIGNSADNTLAGGQGDDVLIGGLGTDTAVVSSLSRDAIVRSNSDGSVSVIGPDGNDRLIGIEFIQFDDETIALFDDSKMAPIITSDSTANVDEDQTAAYIITAFDQDAGDELTYSIAGTDADFFDIDGLSGAVRFRTAPDFEAPADSNSDNEYEIIVKVTDATGLTDSKDVRIAVEDVAETPMITSSATASVEENQTSAFIATATDPDFGDAATFSITGGDDAELFDVNPVSGEVTFIDVPDFENPADSDGDNHYRITITATDRVGLADTLNVTIAVEDVDEAPRIISASPFDGEFNVAADGAVVLTFSSAIQSGVGNIELRAGSADGAIVEAFDIETSDQISFDGTRLVVDPASDLMPNTTYFLVVPQGAVEDLAGNPFAGLNDYDFTVAFDPASALVALSSDAVFALDGGDLTIVGTRNGSETAILNAPSAASLVATFDPTFNQGGDTIVLPGDPSSYSVARSGSSVTFSGDRLSITVPVGIVGATIRFARDEGFNDDDARTLVYDTDLGQVVLGDQVITFETAEVAAISQNEPIQPIEINQPAVLVTLQAGEEGEALSLTDGNFNLVGTRDGTETVLLGEPNYGSLSAVFDPTFNSGGDTIVLAGSADDYSAIRSGSSVVLTNGSITATIPVGIIGATVTFANAEGQFDDDARILVFDTEIGQILLGNQTVTFEMAAVSGPTGQTSIKPNLASDAETKADSAQYIIDWVSLVSANEEQTAEPRGRLGFNMAKEFVGSLPWLRDYDDILWREILLDGTTATIDASDTDPMLFERADPFMMLPIDSFAPGG